MKVILDIGVFCLAIGCSFFVGAMYAAQYVIYLLHKEGYRKVKKSKEEEKE